MKLFELAAAWMRGYYNEISLDQKHPSEVNDPNAADPVKFRFGAWELHRQGSGAIGVISMDLLDGDLQNPRRREMGFLKFEIDHDQKPCVELHLQQDMSSHEDHTMKRVFRMLAEKIEFDTTEVKGLPGSGGVAASGPPAIIRAPGGQTELHMQGDGNCVAYDVRPGITLPPGESGPWVALSTLQGGKIRDFREDGQYAG